MNVSAVLVLWLALAAMAVANGMLREKVWRRWLIEDEAHALSTLIGSALILLTCFLTIDWMQPTGLAGAWAIGGIWLVITLVFEFVAGHYLFGNPWSKLFADYNAMRGRVWWLVLACTLVGPPFAFRGFDAAWAIPYAISLLVAVGILISAYRKPGVSRWLIAVVFGYACVYNGWLALTNPTAYLDFSRFALIPDLVDYIRGPFADHASDLILSIAVGQGIVALAMAVGGRALWIGVVGCSLFLTAIIPLGLGSAFPFSVIVTLASLIVLGSSEGYSGVPGKTTSFNPKKGSL